jgi:hypothetical protein
MLRLAHSDGAAVFAFPNRYLMALVLAPAL